VFERSSAPRPRRRALLISDDRDSTVAAKIEPI
jgi:hypothetical protein